MSTALVALSNNIVLHGEFLVNPGEIITGELCFTTALNGYQEAITDPSYQEQILVFAIPHIGITGINKLDDESVRPVVKAIIVNDITASCGHHLEQQGFSEWAQFFDIPVIFNIDTRSLIHHIRNTQHPLKTAISHESTHVLDVDLINIAKGSSSLESQCILARPTASNDISFEDAEYKVAIIDFGVKKSIINSVTNRLCAVKIFYPNSTFAEIKSYNPDGIILSNGPGSPVLTFAKYKELIIDIVESSLPVLGICLGYQLVALAFGAVTRQMQTPHHGINHPVMDYENNKVVITSQNHEFAVIEDSISDEVLMPTFRSLFDNSLEGFKVKNRKILAVQFHPEGGPGPVDADSIFDDFIDLIEE